MLQHIRQELRRCHGLLKHGETAAESVVAEHLASLHDAITIAEGKQIVVAAPTVAKLRALEGAPAAIGKEETTAVDALLKYAELRRAENDKAGSEEANRKNVAAAAQALAVPAEIPPSKAEDN